MKTIKFLLVTMFGIANLCIAQAAPPIQVTKISKHLPIGGVAVTETLAQAEFLEITCSAPSAAESFFRKVKIKGLESPDDLLAIIKKIDIDCSITDPKDYITITGTIKDGKDQILFRSERPFQMEKTGYDVDGEAVYITPSWAGDMYFVISDINYYIAGVTEGYMLAINGDMHQLNVIDGMIQVPGWMNYGYFSELVINGGQYRFDMITGDLLEKVTASIETQSVSIHSLEDASHDGNLVSITPAPQYGTPATFKVNIADSSQQSFQLQVYNPNGWWWLQPLIIKVARLEDLRPGGIGWTNLPYQQGMWINVSNTGTYYIYAEYKSQDIGQLILYPQQTVYLD